MRQFNKSTGKFGEAKAAVFLAKMGYVEIERNYHNKIGEIDLIMEDSQTLVFVEVKTKTGDKFGSPEEMISRTKISQVRRTAESYLMFNPKVKNKFPKCRIDAVCIVVNDSNEVQKIKHYRNLY